MNALHYKSLFRGMLIGWIAAIALVVLAGCATTRPQRDPTPLVPPVAATVSLDSLAGLPAYLVPAPAGSSPAQRRQWQRAQAQNLARAGVGPQKIKNSSVASAPGAVAVNRPASSVATGGGTATDARKAGTRGGSAAVGAGAVATATSAGTPLWVYFLVAVCGAVVWEYASSQLTPLRALLKWRSG